MVVRAVSTRSATRHLLDTSWSMHQVLGILTLLLEMVQRRATRFVKWDYDRTSSVTSMLADLKWNTLQERAAEFYKIAYYLVAIPTAPYLIPARSSRGHRLRLFLIQSTVNVPLYSFFPSTMRIWNQLPPEVISVPSLWMFKQRLPLMITHQLHVKRSSVFKSYISCFYLRCNCLGRHMFIIALKFENTQFAEWRTHRKKKKNPRGKSVQVALENEFSEIICI